MLEILSLNETISNQKSSRNHPALTSTQISAAISYLLTLGRLARVAIPFASESQDLLINKSAP